jgi:hypothetical protein
MRPTSWSQVQDRATRRKLLDYERVLEDEKAELEAYCPITVLFDKDEAGA